jgi:hypothetical protein
MRRTIVLLSAGLITLAAGSASAQNASPRNLILFVPDGLRGRIVTPQTAPAMAELRDKGVNFVNPHALFPTFTMANASGLGSPPGSFAPTTTGSGSSTGAPHFRQMPPFSGSLATGPSSASWSAPTGSRDEVKSHFG